MKLLTLGNPKTAKGIAKNYLTAILHLAPYKLSGYNVCPMAEIAGCVKTCLNTAGRGGIAPGGGQATYDTIKNGRHTNIVQEARIRRTRLFMENRETFMTALAEEIRTVKRHAKRLGLKPAIRLNGTSDIAWENISLDVKVTGFNAGWTTRCKNVFEAFPDVQFYDYTKISNRKVAHIKNYHLTFSYSGSPVYAPYIERAIKNYGDKINISVVFGIPLPETFLGRPVVNGDESDLRFLDPPGVIVGLKAKGQAKKDTSGFVVQ